MPEAAPHLATERLCKRYGNGAPVVDAVDLGIGRGEFVTLLGPSGCGKTTTLRMIAGLVEPSGGRIRIDGADITALPAHRRNMGLVFQSYALFPHLSVARNVAFGLEMRGIDRATAARRVDDALALVRLDGYQARRPRELSGGQQQRVALARALVIEPALLLLDEPLSNLDAKLRDELRQEIRDIQQRLGTTTLFVTHDQVEALTMSDRIVVMAGGRVEQVGTPEAVYERPASRFVATFLGRMNEIPATVDAAGADGVRLSASGLVARAPGGSAGAGRVVMMVRPHVMTLLPDHVTPGDGANVAAGHVVKRIYVGDRVQVDVAVGDLVLSVEGPAAGPRPEPGSPVRVAWPVSDTLLFDAG